VTDIIGIWINCPSADIADAIADALLKQRLVACSNRYAPISSRYYWEGGLEAGEEVPLLVKTRAAHFEAVEEVVRALHPFETPAIFAMGTLRTTRDYADWVCAETRAP
jgi:periplasmic divalent cation tolerance protein